MTRFSKPQRQEGVNMVRIKLPLGKINVDQLFAIAEVSEKYTNGNLHTTTRQDIQLHYIKHRHVDELWDDLISAGVSRKESFGNTLRNITASTLAGIDPEEAFDVTPYVERILTYFDGHESCSDMGRKVKIAFSSNQKDSAYTFMNDIGFVPLMQNDRRGFRVVLGGGMAGQTMVAKVSKEFLPEEYLLSYLEAILRVFSQYGERLNRAKGRLKFLISKVGFDTFISLLEEEFDLIKEEHSIELGEELRIPQNKLVIEEPVDTAQYQDWLKTNVLSQKQPGFKTVSLKLRLGNISSAQVQKLGPIIRKYASETFNVTSNQGLQLNFVLEKNLPAVFNALHKLGLAEIGYNSAHDITACPGTDTCNLGITNSTDMALEIEQFLLDKYAELVFDKNIKIKISGCVNSCGHHTVANIGLQGTTLKYGDHILPASKILLGGGVDQFGVGSVSDKISTVPARRVIKAIDTLLSDYEAHAFDEEYFNNYYQRQGQNYFVDLFKPFSDLDHVRDEELTDWGNDGVYQKHTPVFNKPQFSDLVHQLMNESGDKLEDAEQLIASEDYNDAVIHVYNSFVRIAKSLLLSKNIECSTQVNVLSEFDNHFVAQGEIPFDTSFKEYVLSYKKMMNTEGFISEYLNRAKRFLALAKDYLSDQTLNA